MTARILVVEDQDSIREFTRAILAAAGHDVTIASNGAEAVAAVHDGDFDLILMDLSMPVMDGLTATRQIRALEGARAKIPIIAFSAATASPEIGGMNDHVRKPFRKADLLRKVDAWLDRGAIPPSAASQPSTPEGPAFEEVCNLMGRPWALRGLRKLKVEIEAFVTDPRGSAKKDGRLVHQAHSLVSLSAVLGFSTLSERCSALEEACRGEHALQVPYKRAKVAALEARTAAIRLISNLRIE